MIVFRKTFAVLAAVLLALAAAGVHAQAPGMPQLNRDYLRLDPPRPVASGDRIEVIEFFYYGCPVCYELEPTLARWMSNASGSVALHRVPALSSDNWDNFAKLFYTLEATGHLAPALAAHDNFHFDGIKLNEEPAMVSWWPRTVSTRKIHERALPEIQAKLAKARK